MGVAGSRWSPTDAAGGLHRDTGEGGRASGAGSHVKGEKIFASAGQEGSTRHAYLRASERTGGRRRATRQEAQSAAGCWMNKALPPV